MEQFARIKRLPPYVFNIVNELKAEARNRGEDIIDFGMGNPDQATPDLIVEILSPSTRRLDRKIKRRLFERFGVPEYWIVDLDARAVERYVGGPSGLELVGRETESVTFGRVPDCRVDLGRIW